jgi:flagellar biosynthesis/type III secretory pathway chaperone
MTEHLKLVISTLREELKHYGEMIALLDQQQEYMMARATEDLFQSVAVIQAQSNAIQAARRVREGHQKALALKIGLTESAGFADIIPLLPADYRPLVQALVQENNHLLVRVQQRARQNHLLLSRSCELMQSLIGTLFPSRDTTTYTDRGGRFQPSLPVNSLYEAVG